MSEGDTFVFNSLENWLCLSNCARWLSLRGRLSLWTDFWRYLQVLQFILNVISQGYKIRFLECPTTFVKANNGFTLSNSTFVFQVVNELLDANLVEEIFELPDVINSLSVSTLSSRKQRLILDLRHVNSFILEQRFKCKEELISTDFILKIASHANLQSPVGLRNVTMYVLCFTGFFRVDEVSRVRRSDISFKKLNAS